MPRSIVIDISNQGNIDPGELGCLEPRKYVGGVRVCFDPRKNVIFFHSKLLLDNSASFTSSRMKDMCQKWKVKLNFWGTYRLSGTDSVESLEIIDVGCNMKQIDGLTWLSLTPIFYEKSTPLSAIGNIVTGFQNVNKFFSESPVNRQIGCLSYHERPWCSLTTIFKCNRQIHHSIQLAVQCDT